MILALALTLACHGIDGDRILGSDLAAASPAFAALDPDTVVASTPIPGVRRVLHAAELVRIAAAHNIAIPAPAPELCFERVTEPLTSEKILPILKSALDNTQIEILDFSRAGVPRGTLEFTKSGLSSAGVWRGRVLYSQGRSMPVWARVRVTTEQTWVEAAASIEPGKLIDPPQLALRTGARFPFGPAPLASIDAAAGRKAMRSIKPGEPIFASMLIAPHDVERGEKVSVQVISGDASLSFDAVAESSGRAGDSVLIRNPENGRDFPARVEGKGKVSVKK